MRVCLPERNMNRLIQPACAGENFCNEFLKPFGLRVERRFEPLSTRG
jgi:hypothetical protein